MIARRDLHGLWALTWRSVVYLPVALALFAAMIFVPAALLLLPIIFTADFFYGEWSHGLAALGLWLLAFGAWRYFRMRELFRDGGSYL